MISKEDQLKLFNQFWKLSDEKKLHFYSKFVERKDALRKRTANEHSRKHKTFVYHFELNGQFIRVCREFFLTTINVSQSRIYYFFRTNMNTATGVAKSPMKGKHQKHCIPPDVLDHIREHIKSFPVVDSHYCRASTQKQYLDQRLSVPKMYDLYLESDLIKSADHQPAKLHMYRKIFDEEFNYGFFKPRKDRCDTCEAFKMSIHPSEEQQLAQNLHLQNKLLGKEERDADRAEHKKGTLNNDSAVLCFDMENVMSLPRAEVSNFFYKRKLNSYNLTLHCSLSGKTYNAVWHEALAGRAANNIASALVKLLYAVCNDHPNLKSLILWSDSCVPQNRNSIMSTALAMFLSNKDVNITLITQKFLEPGHGLIQEVDAIHSKIERGLSSTEIYSPVSLMRLLMKLSTKRSPLQFIQMKKEDFKNYQAVSSKYKFSDVPYTKVKQLQYKCNNIMYVDYRCNFNDNYTSVRINRNKSPRLAKGSTTALSPGQLVFPERAPILNSKVILTSEKLKDLKSMFCYMPQVDVAFYKTIFG